MEALKQPGGGALIPALSDLTTEVDAQSGAVTWSWGCPDELLEDQACKFRYAITRSPAYTFESSHAYEAPTSEGRSIVFDGAHPLFDQDGGYYIHVQYQVVSESSGAVVSTSRIATSSESILDFQEPSVTGLTNDAVATRSKTWNWGCDESACQYRFVVNENATHTFAAGNAFDSTTTATKDTGDGTYYLHVQAQDAAGKLGDVLSVSAILDNTNPSVANLQDDSTPTRSKSWTWACDDSSPCTYRYVINQSPSYTFRAQPFADAAFATYEGASGTYYIHVQARDEAGNLSPVVSVSAVLNSSALGVTGLLSRSRPTQVAAWTWGCTNSSGCTYRHEVNQNPSHTFDSTVSFEADTGATYGGVDGRYYLHVQAQNAAGDEESAVVSVSVILDNTAPSVTGLEDDPQFTKSKTWTWGCSDSTACEYRYRISESTFSNFTPSAVWGPDTQATQATGDGFYYIHVQARDTSGNESAVVSVTVNIRNTAPVIEGLGNDTTPTRSKTWNWRCTSTHCNYRHAITDQPQHTFTNEPYHRNQSATQNSGDGTYYLHIQVDDGIGNTSQVTSVSAILDNTGPSVMGLAVDLSQRPSKTWSWSCSDITDCSYRHVINQNANPPSPMTGTWGSVVTATKDNVAVDGTYYIHVQARDVLENEGDVVSVSAELSSTALGVTGLSDDFTLARSKTWSWGCSGTSCEYRFVVNQNSTHTFEAGDAFGSEATATQNSGDGTYYLHVQAREAQRTSEVLTVSVTLDNTAPVVTGITSDTTPTRSKTWTWGCDDAGGCVYRHKVSTSDTETFSTSEAYGAVVSAVQDSGDSTYYLYVQARDVAGNESEVMKVSAILDTMAPTLNWCKFK